MKANITNLKKILQICAEAHNAEFEDWSDEGQLGVWSTTPGTICDVQMILESFFGDSDAMEVSCGVGCITIWLGEIAALSKRDVDVETLSLALPYGTKL